ncbi:MAG: anion permease [Chloroflexi bacterium]|nr:anion permease [Chloroflexota bacterium]MDL1885742.1 inorganic phosphate transporter [Anaerolineae bacterium CFX8]
MFTFSFLLILLLTFAFGYLNGVNGAGSVIATVISSRALKPNAALALALLCICAGPFVFGLAVAGTMSTDLVSLSAVTIPLVIATLGGAIGWTALAAWLRLPCSMTQALIGSLLGTTWIGFGTQAIIPNGAIKALLALLLSPVLGIAAGYIMVKLFRRMGASTSPRINRWFKTGQVIISLLVALAFGSNDGQKVIGIIALGVMATSSPSEFNIPSWAAVFAAAAMAAGTLAGSKRLVRTLGSRLYNVQPIHGFGAQTASSIVLLAASLTGSPVSGSQVIASAIVGAGSAERIHKVRWGIFQQICGAWALTLPLSALTGTLLYMVISRLML